MPKARQQAHAAQARGAILSAAARCFLRRGYAASTMNDIAKEAGYTAPTLYTYFSGKEDIFDSLVNRTLDAIFETFERPVPAGLSFLQQLDLLLTRQYEIAQSHREDFLFLLRLSSSSEVRPTRHQDRGLEVQQKLRDWMAAAQQSTSEFTHHDPEILAVALSSLSRGFLARWAASGGDQPVTELVPLVLALFAGGVGATDAPQ